MSSATKRDPYVVAELQGRLGNQLFQFASALAIANAGSARLVFSSHRVAPEDLLLPQLIGGRYVEASAGELLRVGQLVSDGPLTRAYARAVYYGARSLRRMRGRKPPSVTYWENTGTFRPSVFDLTLPVYVQGHLQSEKYFATVEDEVIEAIRWPAATPQLPDELRPAVAVSFRRGDYNSLGWALPLDYYDDALGLVAEHTGDMTLVLFGDDLAFLELARDRLHRYGRVATAAELGQDPIAQLRIMSECEHCIIANSSFAWWGAWIGDHRAKGVERIVVAPEEYGWPDRVPTRWRVLPTGIPRT